MITNSDKIKLVLSGLVFVFAIVLFYLLSEQLLVVRVLSLLILFVVGVFIAAKTEPGSAGIAYGRGAWIEVRKVIWPTRKETFHTTLIVFAMVIIVGIILWLFDMLLVWLIRIFTGQ
jgi:preprotein translocase subunit SecE